MAATVAFFAFLATVTAWGQGCITPLTHCPAQVVLLVFLSRHWLKVFRVTASRVMTEMMKDGSRWNVFLEQTPYNTVNVSAGVLTVPVRMNSACPYPAAGIRPQETTFQNCLYGSSHTF